MFRLTLHGEAGKGLKGRAIEVQIVQAFEDFIKQVEAIEGHGVYLAQFEGATGFHRHRGEDQTLVETQADDETVIHEPFEVR